MFEKVNPSHPDKVADRIAGALVDIAYRAQYDPKVAIEVLIGHGICHIIAESSYDFEANHDCVVDTVERICGCRTDVDIVSVPQDEHLARNQHDNPKCGDNGIFKGVPLSEEEIELTHVARNIYSRYQSDGKYVIDGETLIICQSNARSDDITEAFPNAIVNPLGEWTGGTDVDTGATNRKLGSDMARGVTGGGLHGKDLSKADVSANIYAFLKAQETGETVELCCAIGDEEIDGVPYREIIETARRFIEYLGGFEKLAEWGLF